MMKQYMVICIDDDEQFLSSLEAALPDKVSLLCEHFNCRFEFVATAEELFHIIAESSDATTAMIIADQVMPGITGIDLIETLKQQNPDLVCVLLTGHAGLDSAKYAINRHLLDQYASKPIDDLQEFAALVANLLKKHHLNLEERERTIQLAQTVEALRISNDKIKAMHGAAEQVAMLSKNLKALDLDEVVELVTHEVPKLFGAEWSVLCFPESGYRVGANDRKDCPCTSADLLARKDTGWALECGDVYYGPGDEVCARLGAGTPELIIPLGVPAVTASGSRGTMEKGYLCLCRIDQESAVSSDLMEYKARLISEVLSANLASARLYHKARQESETDSLTGVSSRRVLEARLEVERERVARYGGNVCIAIVDVDSFKSINDAMGHSAGDELLKQLAAVLQQEARSVDLVARYGGDEFVVLMPETKLEDAATAAERIRTRVASIVLAGVGRLTISCGVAESSSTEISASDVLRRADAALYEAKRAGRDRVSIAKAA